MDAINLKNYFFYFASFVIIIAGVKMASEVVVILFLAIFISSIFSSVLNLLKNRKIPKIISYLLLVLIVLIVGFMFVYVINISLKDFLTNLPLYEEKLRNLVLNSIHLIQSYGFQIEIDRAKIMEVLNLNAYFIFDVNTYFGFDEVAQGTINIDIEDKFIAIDAFFENDKLQTNITLFEKEKSGKYRKEQDKIVQEYHKKEYLEKILKNSGFEIVEIKEFFLHTDESADKLIFICKKHL